MLAKEMQSSEIHQKEESIPVKELQSPEIHRKEESIPVKKLQSFETQGSEEQILSSKVNHSHVQRLRAAAMFQDLLVCQRPSLMCATQRVPTSKSQKIATINGYYGKKFSLVKRNFFEAHNTSKKLCFFHQATLIIRGSSTKEPSHNSMDVNLPEPRPDKL